MKTFVEWIKSMKPDKPQANVTISECEYIRLLKEANKQDPGDVYIPWPEGTSETRQAHGCGCGWTTGRCNKGGRKYGLC